MTIKKTNKLNLDIGKNHFLSIYSRYKLIVDGKTWIKAFNLNFKIGTCEKMNLTLFEISEVVENILEEYFLPIQSNNVFWISFKIVNHATNQIYKMPLNKRGALDILQGNPLLYLTIEFHRANIIRSTKQYLAGVPEIFEDQFLKYQKFEKLFLEIQMFKFMSLEYVGFKNIKPENQLIACTIRGDFHKKIK
ncbi:hypothetical protein [Escherichia coli]|uniref:hypothetical protein n=1 Tax=Escherichia coli TaxID=562 RepID=UPI003B994CDE